MEKVRRKWKRVKRSGKKMKRGGKGCREERWKKKEKKDGRRGKVRKDEKM